MCKTIYTERELQLFAEAKKWSAAHPHGTAVKYKTLDGVWVSARIEGRAGITGDKIVVRLSNHVYPMPIEKLNK